MPQNIMQIDDSWILNALMENIADSIYIKDRQCRLCRLSKKMYSDLGFSDPEVVYGKTDVELFGEEFGKKTFADDLRVMETGQPIISLIESWVNESGKTNWTSTTKLPLRNETGEIIGLLGITREINDLKHSEIELQWLANHDPLTSLANRYLLMEHIRQAIFNATNNKLLFALLFIDLNGFKQINDKFGHERGDQLLQILAKVLVENVRGLDTVARIGGDEFVILLEGLNCSKDAITLAKKIANLIEQQVDPENHLVTASIGISTYPDNGFDQEILLEKADQAMYDAKNTGLQYKKA